VSVVYTGGTFDVFHAGHVDLLRACRVIAGPSGRVVVALNRDAFVVAFKGRAPVCSLAERRVVVAACRHVDEVIVNEGDADSTQAIERVLPDVLVIGQDWASRDYHAQMGFTPTWLGERGIVLLYADRSRVMSSTMIRNRARDG
jgi:cytidyltransferase-like protein